MMIARDGKYFGAAMICVCDAKCHKAWGMNNRPKAMLSDNEDDYEYLADSELGEAPIDPGTYEGSEAKPTAPDERLNKWCWRECERSVMVEPNEEFELPDFTERRRNIQP
jgi:hypothetical protein